MAKPTIVQTDFDRDTIGTSTQMIKAVIPFLPGREQKMIGIMVRAMELNMTIEYYSKHRLGLFNNAANDADSILSSIKEYCSKEERQQLDMMMGMMKMQQLQNGGTMDLLSGFLTPEQMKMYKEFENML